MAEHVPLLSLQNISKAFPGTQALDGVNFDLMPGEVHALIGENGAGKSTLIKVTAGLYQPDNGTVAINGQEVNFRTPADSLAHRIKVVYQELDLVPHLSVAENVFLGNLPKTMLGTIKWGELRQRTAELLQELGLEIDPTVPISTLTVAEQQLVEIARALSQRAQIIIMDEPTSALSASEIEKLFSVVRRMQDRGVGIMYVSHKLDEIYEIADRVTVFRDGQHIVTKPVSETTQHNLVTWMVGREVGDLYPRTESQVGEVLLKVDGVSGGLIQDMSLEVCAGEIVAVFGLMGSGVHTLGRLIYGDQGRTGKVTIAGEEIRPRMPTDSIRKGLGYLTENRKEDGLMLPLPVKDNITVVSLDNFANMMWINVRKEREAARDIVHKLSVKTPHIRQKIRYLSGGNQQKSLVARWMLEDLKVLVFSEPTRGIDVGAKAEIYRLMDEMALQGMGILVLSTELPEVLGIADRIFVVRQGQITGHFTRDEANKQNVMTAAAATGLAEEV